MNTRRGRLAYTLAALFLSCAVMLGQSTSGDLTGTIYDATGATIPSAEITATNTATDIQVSTTASSSGQYRLSNLLVGTYNLSVSASGFAKAERKNVSVELNKISTLNVTLAVGTAATSVEVSAAAATIDTTNAQIQNNFDTRQLQDLPTGAQGSGIINLSLLNAGVATSGSVGVGTGPSVGGQRPRNNNFTVEGIDNNSKSITGPLVTIPNDAVAEFTVLQNQFSPEYGHSTGGQFNQVVRSGTNEFHGRLYEYLQNRNLNAADQQSIVGGTPPHPGYDDNRFGGQIGGPIKRNKMFFFVNVEEDKLREDTIPGAVYGPTSDGWATISGIPGLSSTNLNVLHQYLGTAATATAPADLPNGDPVVVGGATIPTGLVSQTLTRHQDILSGVASLDYNIS